MQKSKEMSKFYKNWNKCFFARVYLYLRNIVKKYEQRKIGVKLTFLEKSKKRKTEIL